MSETRRGRAGASIRRLARRPRCATLHASPAADRRSAPAASGSTGTAKTARKRAAQPHAAPEQRARRPRPASLLRAYRRACAWNASAQPASVLWCWRLTPRCRAPRRCVESVPGSRRRVRRPGPPCVRAALHVSAAASARRSRASRMTDAIAMSMSPRWRAWLAPLGAAAGAGAQTVCGGANRGQLRPACGQVCARPGSRPDDGWQATARRERRIRVGRRYAAPDPRSGLGALGQATRTSRAGSGSDLLGHAPR